MRHSPLRLAALALALTASRAFGDAHCVGDIRDAGPDGSFCHGSTKPSGGTAPPAAASPAAINQLTGAVGAGLGSMLGNALVAPLPNQYQHKPVKSVVKDDDDDVFKSHPIGITAADDIIGNYKADDNSYAGKLNHFRQLHDAEMEKRRDALDLIKGTSAEKWCAAHINILFPSPPVSDVLNRYGNTVRAYDREKQTWDKKCGGPSLMPGYESFTEGLAALKPDAPPAAAAAAGSTRKAPQYDASPAAPSEEPAKIASNKPTSEADDELLPTPPHQDKTEITDAPPAAQRATPPAAGAASDAAPTPDDSANTNHSTEFFGEKNAKVTAKDLADSRAPELTDSHGGAPGAGTPGAGSPGSAPSPGSTPKMLSDKPLRVLPSGPPLGAFTPREYGFEGRGGYDRKYEQVWGQETSVDKFIAKWNFVVPMESMQKSVRDTMHKALADKVTDEISPKSIWDHAYGGIKDLIGSMYGGKGIKARIDDTDGGRAVVKSYASGLTDRTLDNVANAVGDDDQQAAALNALDEEAKKRDDLRNDANREWMSQVKDPMDLIGTTKEQNLKKISAPDKSVPIQLTPVCYTGDTSLGISCGPKIVTTPSK